MDLADLEGTSHAIYDLAGYDDSDIARPIALARALGIRVIAVPNMVELARLSVVNDESVIAYRQSIPNALRAFAIMHEINHWFRRRSGCGDEGMHVEEECDLVAAMLLAPRRAFQKALRIFGDEAIPDVAHAFAITETCAWLRLGEVTNRPLALVSPQLVRVRGQLEFVWPAESVLRLEASARRPRSGLRKVRLTDDRRRTVILPEEYAEAA